MIIRPKHTTEIIAGAHNIREEEKTQQRRYASTENAGEVIVHEKWDASALNNDVALLILKTPFELNEHVQTIRLLRKSDTNRYEGEEARVSGWGRTAGSSAISNTLNQVFNNVMPNPTCQSYFGNIIDSNKCCVSGKDGKSSCNGDSGGPLVTKESDGEWVQIGVVSFGIALGCTVGFPHAYTWPLAYLNWIENNSDYKGRD